MNKENLAKEFKIETFLDGYFERHEKSPIPGYGNLTDREKKLMRHAYFSGIGTYNKACQDNIEHTTEEERELVRNYILDQMMGFVAQTVNEAVAAEFEVKFKNGNSIK